MRLLATLLLLIAAPALADGGAAPYLRAANMLYQKLEYEKALDQLERARKVAAGLEDDVKISLWEGILLAELGRMDDARTAFNTALALSVDAKLPVKVSPKVTAEFEKLRVDAKKELARAVTPAPIVPNPARPPTSVDSAFAETAPPPAGPPPTVVEAPQPRGGVRRLAVIPFAIGAAGAVAGIVGAAGGANAAGQLKGQTLTLQQAREARDSGSMFQIVGFVGVGVGAAGLIAGSLMMLFGGPSDSPVTLAPIAGGATVGLRIPLP
jgi:tetratricopeptide (TPR) repeat protein